MKRLFCLAVLAAVALALLGVWLAQRADDANRASLDAAAQKGGRTDGAPAQAPVERAAVSKKDGGADKTPPPLPFGDKLVPDGYRWGDPHPWLKPVLFEYDRRYVGPQTAEAIFAVMHSGQPLFQRDAERAAKLLEHYKYILARGAVIRDRSDARRLGEGQFQKLDMWRKSPEVAELMRRDYGLPADAPLQALMDAEIDHWIKIWTPMKE